MEVVTVAKEKEVGKIDHFYDKISVGVIALTNKLAIGDKIHVQGTHGDFEQEVGSMQLDHKDVKEGKKGQAIAIKVDQPVHKNDKVFVLSE